MKKNVAILGVILIAGLAMALPHLLRQQKESTREKLPATGTIPKASSEIEISDFKFAQAKLTVEKGTTVTWTNKDKVGHTVTGERGGPDSDIVTENGTYSYTFNEVGEFRYFCKPHPFMRGTIEVIE